eukprot:5474928-Prymnesium_polylepis.1
MRPCSNARADRSCLGPGGWGWLRRWWIMAGEVVCFVTRCVVVDVVAVPNGTLIDDGSVEG